LLVPTLLGVPFASLFVSPLLFPTGELLFDLLGTFKLLFFDFYFGTATLAAFV
jgi:hypothetical protein